MGTWVKGSYDKKESKKCSEMEEKCLKIIKEQLEPHLEGYEIGFKFSKSHLDINKKDAHTRACISFYYGRYSRGAAKSIQLSCIGDYLHKIDSIGRNYKFDFHKYEIPEASLKKIVSAIKNHFDSIQQAYDSTAKSKEKSLKHTEIIKENLESGGFKVDVRVHHDTDHTLVIDGVGSFGVSSTGLIYSMGKAESVPVRADKNNIVEVAKTIKHLREVIQQGSH